VSYPKTILMSHPRGFRIESAINPHMRDANGNLKVANYEKALEQWQAMRRLYESIGFRVVVIEGGEAWPDMVFCANQTFPFLDSKKRPAIALSTMRSDTRKGEVPLFEKWARAQGLQIYLLTTPGSFEGSGDALWDFSTSKIYGGYGFRTDRAKYAELETLTGKKIVPLELRDERFYHLDTCLVLLGNGRAAYVEEAFTKDGLRTLKSEFKDLIRIAEKEAIENFAGNAFCPDGRNVVLQKGANSFVEALRQRDFKVHEVETEEFIKAGGSVFCTKQQLWL
jgi:N-dimethylarginine dimethylaminohydrolase